MKIVITLLLVAFVQLSAISQELPSNHLDDFTVLPAIIRKGVVDRINLEINYVKKHKLKKCKVKNYTYKFGEPVAVGEYQVEYDFSENGQRIKFSTFINSVGVPNTLYSYSHYTYEDNLCKSVSMFTLPIDFKMEKDIIIYGENKDIRRIKHYGINGDLDYSNWYQKISNYQFIETCDLPADSGRKDTLIVDYKQYLYFKKNPKYDSNGRVIEVDSYPVKLLYSYDANGLLRECLILKDDEPIAVRRFEYEFYK